MTTGNAAVLNKPNGSFAVEAFQVPEPAPGTVLLKMELAGCCATDAHCYLGWWKSEFPVIMGHENVGIVEAIGEGGRQDVLGRDLKVGDRVVARSSWCGSCYECRTLRMPRRCRNKKVSHGYTALETSPFSGGYGQYLYLASPETTFIYKTEVPASRAVLHEPLGVATGAVRRAQPRLGETVVIQGCGAIGLFTLGVAKLAGAGRAIVVGGPPERLALAREFGADVTIDITQIKTPEERTRAVLAETLGGAGADVVYGCVGLTSAFAEGINYLRDMDGRFLEVGLASDNGTLPFNPCTMLVEKNATYIGALGMNDQDNLSSIRMIESGRLPVEHVVSHQLTLDQVGEAMQSLNGDYRVNGQPAFKLAIAPNGPVD